MIEPRERSSCLDAELLAVVAPHRASRLAPSATARPHAAARATRAAKRRSRHRGRACPAALALIAALMVRAISRAPFGVRWIESYVSARRREPAAQSARTRRRAGGRARAQPRVYVWEVPGVPAELGCARGRQELRARLAQRHPHQLPRAVPAQRAQQARRPRDRTAPPTSDSAAGCAPTASCSPARRPPAGERAGRCEARARRCATSAPAARERRSAGTASPTAAPPPAEHRVDEHRDMPLTGPMRRRRIRGRPAAESFSRPPPTTAVATAASALSQTPVHGAEHMLGHQPETKRGYAPR